MRRIVRNHARRADEPGRSGSRCRISAFLKSRAATWSADAQFIVKSNALVVGIQGSSSRHSAVRMYVIAWARASPCSLSYSTPPAFLVLVGFESFQCFRHSVVLLWGCASSSRISPVRFLPVECRRDSRFCLQNSCSHSSLMHILDD